MLRRLLKSLPAIVLEVFGGAGAVWGCSEAFGVRGGPNNDAWRRVCDVVGVICALRWFYILLEDKPESPQSKVLAEFLLQVLGGAGAIWGFSEILGLRVNYPPDCHDTVKYPDGVGNAWAPGYETCRNTYAFWRIVTVCFLAWFWAWWVRGKLPVLSRLECIQEPGKLGAISTLFSTFVLEVLGAAGAVWGVSEVAGRSGHSLRLGWGDEHFGQESCDEWRVVCAVTFAVFLPIWLTKVMCGKAGAEPTVSAAAAPLLQEA